MRSHRSGFSKTSNRSACKLLKSLIGFVPLANSLQRTEAYASAHRTSRALAMSLFEQPVIRVLQQNAKRLARPFD
jgi:hypothetical protein